MIWATIVTVLLLLVLHWFPWPMLLGRKLPRLAAYVTGMAAVLGPLTVVHWGSVFVWDLWLATAAGGLAVGLAWLGDWIMNKVKLAGELAELLRAREKGARWYEERLADRTGWGAGEE